MMGAVAKRRVEIRPSTYTSSVEALCKTVSRVRSIAFCSSNWLTRGTSVTATKSKSTPMPLVKAVRSTMCRLRG